MWQAVDQKLRGLAALRRSGPRRIVEVGSGYSSAMTLDPSERRLGGDVGMLNDIFDIFEIRWFHGHMWHHHRQLLETRLPVMAKSPGGNLWLQRARARA